MEANGIVKPTEKRPSSVKPKNNKKSLVEAFGKVITEKTLSNQIKVKFYEYLEKMNDNDTKQIGFKELKLLINKYNSKEMIVIYLPLLMNFNKNSTNSYKEFQIILIGYTISTGGFSNIGGYNSLLQIVESLYTFLKEPSLNIHKSCSHVMVEMFDCIPDKNDPNKISNLLIHPFINLINKSTNNGIDVNKNNVITGSCIILSDVIQHIVKQEESYEDLLQKVFPQLLLILNKYNIETPYLFEAISSIIEVCSYEFLKDKLPYIYEKIIKILMNNSSSLYLTKIECCGIIMKIIGKIKNQGNIDYYDQVLKALENSCKDRVAKVQIASNEVLNEWLKLGCKGEVENQGDNNNHHPSDRKENKNNYHSSSKLNKLNLLRNLSKMNKDKGGSLSPKNIKEEIYDKGMSSLLKTTNFLKSRENSELVQTYKKFDLKSTSSEKLKNSRAENSFINTIKKGGHLKNKDIDKNNIKIYYKERKKESNKEIEESKDINAEDAGKILETNNGDNRNNYNPVAFESEDVKGDNKAPEEIEEKDNENASNCSDSNRNNGGSNDCIPKELSKVSDPQVITHSPKSRQIEFLEDENIGTELVNNKDDSFNNEIEVDRNDELVEREKENELISKDYREENKGNEGKNDNFQILPDDSLNNGENNPNIESNAVKNVDETNEHISNKNSKSEELGVKNNSQAQDSIISKTNNDQNDQNDQNHTHKNSDFKIESKNLSFTSSKKKNFNSPLLVNTVESQDSFTIKNKYNISHNLESISNLFSKLSDEFEDKLKEKLKLIDKKFQKLKELLNKVDLDKNKCKHNQNHNNKEFHNSQNKHPNSIEDSLNLSMITERLIYEGKETERNQKEENTLLESTILMNTYQHSPSKNENMISTTSLNNDNCPVTTHWQNILKELENQCLNKAYEMAFNFGDDILLLRLLFLTGVCLDHLNQETSVKLLTRIISISRCHLVEEIVYQLLNQSAELDIFNKLEMADKNEALETLYEYSLISNAPIGVKSQKLYKLILKL